MNTDWSAQRWLNEVANGLTALRELDASSPTRMVYGADGLGRLSFGLITKQQPGSPRLSEAVDIFRYQREHDNSWILLLTLKNQSFAEVFVQLCSHVHSKVSPAKNEKAGLTAAMGCFDEWRRLFLGKQRRLSLEECRGLYAELSFGFQHAADKVDPDFVVECWQGPYGADQDFQFPSVHYEIKSRHPTTHALQISSEYQLSGDKVVLVSVEVVDSTQPLPGFNSLPRLIGDLRQTIADDNKTLNNFDTAIDELGFNPEDDYYSERFFKCGAVDYFAVQDDFPRITAQNLPVGVTGVKYKLELDALSGYILDAETALKRANNYEVMGT